MASSATTSIRNLVISQNSFDHLIIKNKLTRFSKIQQAKSNDLNVLAIG